MNANCERYLYFFVLFVIYFVSLLFHHIIWHMFMVSFNFNKYRRIFKSSVCPIFCLPTFCLSSFDLICLLSFHSISKHISYFIILVSYLIYYPFLYCHRYIRVKSRYRSCSSRAKQTENPQTWCITILVCNSN